MNERGREVLIQAALSNHRQIREKYHERATHEGATQQEGDCALGVLHLSIHHSRREAVFCEIPIREEIAEPFQLRFEAQRCSLCERNFKNEVEYIIHLNDDHGLDFLTIARKLEETGPQRR